MGVSDYSHLVGKVGSTLTALRPAGVAEFDGERFDVVSEGAFIKAEKLKLLRWRVPALWCASMKINIGQKSRRENMYIELLILIGLIVIALPLLFSFVPLGLWISSLAAGVRISIFPGCYAPRRVPRQKLLIP